MATFFHSFKKSLESNSSWTNENPEIRVFAEKKCENVNFYIYQTYQMIINIMTPEITLRLPVTRKIICQKYYIKRTRPRFLYKVIRFSINGSLKYAMCGASQLIFLFIIYFLLFLLSYIFIYFF